MSLLSRLTNLFHKSPTPDPLERREAAKAALDADDYPRGRAILQSLAEGGDREAQGNFGVMLVCGLGGPVDVAAGLDWLERAAAAGDVTPNLIWGSSMNVAKW